MGAALEERLRTLTVAEVAERLQVESRTVYGLIHRGELRAVKAGRVWRVPLDALDAYLHGAPENDEALTADDLAAIRRGLADIRAGRVVSWSRVKRENGL